MSSEVLKRFENAVDVFDDRIHQVPDDRWSAPTPCTEWDVRALVNHVVGEQLWVVPLIDGRTIADVGDSLDGDLLGSDPCAAWHHASGPAHAAMASDGALERTVHLSYGDESAANYCDQLTFDALVHAWDLASGAGLDTRLPDDLVEWATAWVQPMLAPMQGAGMFATPVDPPPGADAQTRLLALIGRRA
jgi:uncharacterized protein (TIGR03086 family)